MTCGFSAGTIRTRSTASRCVATRRRPERAASGRRKPRKRRRRSSAPTVPDELMQNCRGSVSEAHAADAAPRPRRTAAYRFTVAGQVQLAPQLRSSGLTRSGTRARPASQASLRRGLRCRSRTPAASAPSDFPCAERHSPPQSRPIRPRAPRASPRSPRAERASPRCRTPRSAPRKDVARAGHRRQPRCDQPAGARLRSGQRHPALPREVEHDFLDGRSSSAKIEAA